MDNNNAYNGNGAVPDCENMAGMSSENESRPTHAGRGCPCSFERSEYYYGCKHLSRWSYYYRSTIMNYFNDALEFKNLYKAVKECCRNVRWKDSVVGFETNIFRRIIDLKDSIEKGTYKLQPYQKFTIYEPKKRDIVATRIADRVVQRSLCNSGLYDELTKSFILDNVACQTGKGIDFAMKRMKIHMERYYRKYGNEGWVLKCDIHHFFQSTRHDVAKKCVAKRVSDEQARKMVFNIIDSFDGECGIGLGSQISQLIELAVLDDLDHYIKERLGIKFYIRYMDDFILVHPDKEYLKYCLSEIRRMLGEIGLELNKKTTLSPLKQSIKFCKWRYNYTETGRIIVTMDRKKLSNQRQKLKRLYKMELSGERPKNTVLISLQSWQANAERGDSWKDIRNMYSYFNRMIKEQKNANHKK